MDKADRLLYYGVIVMSIKQPGMYQEVPVLGGSQPGFSCVHVHMIGLFLLSVE